MRQRVITFTKRFQGIDQYSINLDEITLKLNSDGWTIKQVVSTTFQHHLINSNNSYPVIAITLLIENG